MITPWSAFRTCSCHTAQWWTPRPLVPSRGSSGRTGEWAAPPDPTLTRQTMCGGHYNPCASPRGVSTLGPRSAPSIPGDPGAGLPAQDTRGPVGNDGRGTPSGFFPSVQSVVPTDMWCTLHVPLAPHPPPHLIAGRPHRVACGTVCADASSTEGPSWPSRSALSSGSDDIPECHAGCLPQGGEGKGVQQGSVEKVPFVRLVPGPGSGQWNSCCTPPLCLGAPPLCLGAVGSGTPAAHRHSA